MANVTTDANGNASFTVTISATVPAGRDRHGDLPRSACPRPRSSATPSPSPVSSTATFLGTDTTTEGNWRNAYGADGYDIAADTSATDPKLPSYATLSITGASTYIWATSTTDANALQNAADTGRIASTWYTSTTMSFDLDITGGRTHEVSLYAVDFDKLEPQRAGPGARRGHRDGAEHARRSTRSRTASTSPGTSRATS